MHYTTITVGLVEGHEAQDIDDAIAQGLQVLSEEINGPIELVNVVLMVIGERLCVTVMAKPYQPPLVPFRTIPETFMERGLLGR